MNTEQLDLTGLTCSFNEIKRRNIINQFTDQSKEDFLKAESDEIAANFQLAEDMWVEKGGKRAEVGEIHQHSGRDFQKQADGKWKVYTGNKSAETKQKPTEKTTGAPYAEVDRFSKKIVGALESSGFKDNSGNGHTFHWSSKGKVGEGKEVIVHNLSGGNSQGDNIIVAFRGGVGENRKGQKGFKSFEDGVNFAKQKQTEFSKKEVKKAEDIDIEDQDQPDNELEKSDVMRALEYGNEIKVEKTGKDIRNQVQTVVIPFFQAQLAAQTTKLQTILEHCGVAPVHNVSEYWCDGVDIPVTYKRYDWDETRWRDPENQEVRLASSMDKTVEENSLVNMAQSAEQAKFRERYNETLRTVCGIMVDLRACDILMMLDDNKKYTLTPKQLVTLKF